MLKADVAIIGGGIVGLATAYQLSELHPEKRVVVLEKEAGLAQHQTGHNSGVLHSGIYYRPGSLRAKNCRSGKEAMQAFCAANDIDHEICGKVIVAIAESELPALDKIYERGQENGVGCEIIDAERLAELEPHTAGIRAIHVPSAGIVNYRQVCECLARLVQERGGEIVKGAKVTGIHHGVSEITLQSSSVEVAAKYVVNCGGLHSDRVTKMGGVRPEVKIVPFRGEYYELRPEAYHLCRNLIYPVPDPKFPFLGVHFTRMIDGTVECGPNAVLAFAREGYRRRDVNLYDLCESLTYSGFLRLAVKYWRTGAGEMWRSLSKAAFLHALQRLIPEVQSADIHAAPAGVRAQAVSPDGAIVDDFMIQSHDRIVNVCNAPSPAATSSLNVGKLVVEHLSAGF
jgi:L-2-hydroxyglutarate oxidase